MPFKVSFVVDDEALAEELVEDTRETDSMCFTKANGDEVEFGITKISYEEI
jgi:hypothetical protein